VIFSSDDMAHGMCAPFIAGYVIFQKRQAVFGNLGAPNRWGLVGLILSGMLATAGSLGDSTTVLRFAFLISLSSCVLLVGGWRALSQLKFPILLLLFTFPIPPTLYARMTGPLQSLATNLSQSSLELLGFSALREGNLLELPHYRLSIVEACSGIRSLVTLLFFCCIYAYFMKRDLWARIVIVAVSIPAALLLNVVRITLTGVIGEWRPELTQGLYHETLGWICLALGFGMALFFYRALFYLRRGVSHAR
jgi:exosortase